MTIHSLRFVVTFPDIEWRDIINLTFCFLIQLSSQYQDAVEENMDINDKLKKARIFNQSSNTYLLDMFVFIFYHIPSDSPVDFFSYK